MTRAHGDYHLSLPRERTVPVFPLDGVFLCPGLLLPPEIKLELFSELRVDVRIRRLVEILTGPRPPEIEFHPGDPGLN